LRDARGLDLDEFINLHSLGDVGVEDILDSNFIALLADILLGANNLILDLESLAAVFGELLREVVRRDTDHSKVRSFLLSSGLRKVELSSDEAGALVAEMLVEDDSVHRLCEVDVDFVKKGGGVRG